MRSIACVLALATLPLLAGCGSSMSPQPVTSSAPFTKTDLTLGTGAEATAGKLITVNYTGWLYDANQTDGKGQQFDSSLSVGRVPFPFTLGAGQVIAGWDQGLVGMKVGGKRRLVIPPELAYGAAGRPPTIPGNATLVFDVDLLSVQ
jgi:FKBP-type peptidyl-prolyl cis-trans isomerase FkpA